MYNAIDNHEFERYEGLDRVPQFLLDASESTKESVLEVIRDTIVNRPDEDDWGNTKLRVGIESLYERKGNLGSHSITHTAKFDETGDVLMQVTLRISAEDLRVKEIIKTATEEHVAAEQAKAQAELAAINSKIAELEALKSQYQ